MNKIIHSLDVDWDDEQWIENAVEDFLEKVKINPIDYPDLGELIEKIYKIGYDRGY